ncbi:MAG: type II toxin-antitoxin system VapC family toxin [Acidimicrobiia bacterium]
MAQNEIEFTRAEQVIEDYLDLPLTRHGHQALLDRILDPRLNVSAYDAVYVALAESLRGDLLTSDRRLARATSQHTERAVVSP